MHFETFPVGAFQCNCSIIADPKTGDAIVIDPGDEAEKIIERITAKGFTVRYLLHTHAHIDHVGATADVKRVLGGEVCLHRDDLFLYDNLAMQASLLRLKTPSHTAIDHYLEDQQELTASALRIRVLFTPGHTPGSLCFLWEQPNRAILFSGDTLFQGSIGRTDLWGGNYDQIIASIDEQLMTLNTEMLVYPGHGPTTTIGAEKRHNPFLQDAR